VAIELDEAHVQQFLEALRRVSRQLLAGNREVPLHGIYNTF